MKLRPSMRAPSAGSAILSAMIVVALAAVLVSGLLWREQVQLRRIENMRQRDQATWIERGAVDYSRLILRTAADTLPQSDYLGEVWSLPLAQTRLSDFLGEIGIARGNEGANTYLAGQIEDEEARFNLANLAILGPNRTVVIDPAALASFRLLLIDAGINPALADVVAQRIAADRSAILLLTPGAGATSAGSASSGSSSGAASSATSALPGLPLTDLSGLLDVGGFSAAQISVLANWVTILPTATPVNANTASPEVLAAVVPGLQVGDASELVAARNRAYFRSPADLTVLLSALHLDLPTLAVLDVKSHYFLVHARVLHERAEVDRDVLVYRDDFSQHTTRVITTTDAL